jgi:acyl carrier protein
MTGRKSYDEVEEWLVRALTASSGADSDAIDIDKPFVDYRLDSSVAVTVANQLAAWLGAELSLTVFWEYPNIRALASALSSTETHDTALLQSR